MSNPIGGDVVMETEPRPEDIRLLEDRINEFNVQATGITDGKFFSWFLRDENEATIGGIFGWTWGATCYVRYLYIPERLRHEGLGSALMGAVEAEAKRRGCVQIVLETHDFQAPGFYRRLGFEITGRVADYPRDHQYLTMAKRLASGGRAEP